MTHPLAFVLAPAEALPPDGASTTALQEAQRYGPCRGFRLRLFSAGRARQRPLGELPPDGRLDGDGRRSADGCQTLCDAVVPGFAPERHWLGVYRAADAAASSWHGLDRFALTEARNETCWFYPTHDGAYFSWQRQLELTLAFGRVVDAAPDLLATPYDRSQVCVLWSLLADDSALTCVGLTYGRQRIDWALRQSTPAPEATWSRFAVDSAAEVSLVVSDRLTVLPSPSTG